MNEKREHLLAEAIRNLPDKFLARAYEKIILSTNDKEEILKGISDIRKSNILCSLCIIGLSAALVISILLLRQ